jgi:hypothetical protein
VDGAQQRAMLAYFFFDSFFDSRSDSFDASGSFDSLRSFLD